MILKLNIAELNIKLDTDCKKLLAGTEPFIYDFRCEPDVTVKVTDAEIRQFRNRCRGYSAEQAKFRLCCESLAEGLSDFGGFAVRGAALSVNGQGFLFLADNPQTAREQCKALLEANPEAKLIDGTYPIVREEEDGFAVFAGPWSEKKPRRRKEKLAGLFYLVEEGEKTGPVDTRNRLFDLILPEIVLPSRGDRLGTVTGLTERLWKSAKVLTAVCGAGEDGIWHLMEL